FVLSFFPPGQINVGGNTIWFSVLIGGVVLFVVLPFIIYACRKPSWVNPTSNFVPFHWETSPESQKLLAEAKAAYEAEQNASSSDSGVTTAAATPTDSMSADSADSSKS
ncbi:MAG: amino acid transporter, partial [Muribaculaceae bacterium]|nr:amino acid transporter [Muribaculaceae bacterium]